MSEKRRGIDWDEVKSRLHENQMALEKALHPDPERMAAAFRERALLLARRHAGGKTSAESLRLLVFAAGGEQYALDLNAVVELFPFDRCTPVPGAGRQLLGVINVRGEIRSVIDLGRLLELPEAEGELGGCVLLVRHGDWQMGLRVDEVQRTQSLSPGELALPPDAADGASFRCLRGMTRERLRVLNVEALFTHPVHEMPSGGEERSLVRPEALNP